MMVVIGGLMTESTGANRAQVPGLGQVPVAGALFRNGQQSAGKRELVILIKPTVVKSDGDWAEDIASSGQRIRDMSRSECDIASRRIARVIKCSMGEKTAADRQP